MSEYVKRVIEETKAKNPNEPEFHQTVTEVLTSIEPVVERHPEYEAAALLERLVEPERTVMFRVAWVDDEGKARVNKGYRVQFNGAIGPYKGVRPSCYYGEGYDQHHVPDSFGSVH